MKKKREMTPEERAEYHNTSVLLHAMGGGLRAHVEDSVLTASDLDALEIISLMSNRNPDAKVPAIVTAKTRTEILLVNAERLFMAWENSSRSGAHRFRRKIVHAWYFKKHELAQIANDLNRREDVILTQLGIALDQLAVYFFGEGGLQRG